MKTCLVGFHDWDIWKQLASHFLKGRRYINYISNKTYFQGTVEETFDQTLWIKRFQSNALDQTLSIERFQSNTFNCFQSNAFNQMLLIERFQSNAFNRTLLIERYQSNAFNRTLSIYLLDVHTIGNFFHCVRCNASLGFSNYCFGHWFPSHIPLFLFFGRW